METRSIPITLRRNGSVRQAAAAWGQNLREWLLAVDASPYRGRFRTLNCRGMGVCGSCRVKVREGDDWWVRRSCQIRLYQPIEIELE